MINKFEDEYFFLSNFSPSPLPMILADYPALEIYAPTVEHAYQCLKSTNTDEQEAILRASTPNGAKKLGRKVTLRPEWEEMKDALMKDLLLWKFANPDRKKLLLETGDQELVEGNWWGDTYWGVCKGKGKNMLGTLLMQVRDRYR